MRARRSFAKTTAAPNEIGDAVERLRAGLHCGITVACWGALWHHACLLARIRLTRTAAERGPVLSGECGQGALAEINRLRMVERANAHTPPDAEAPGGVECGHWPRPAWSAE
jgi:hypothetical protein